MFLVYILVPSPLPPPLRGRLPAKARLGCQLCAVGGGHVATGCTGPLSPLQCGACMRARVLQAISDRHDAVAEAMELRVMHVEALKDLKKLLAGIRDVERCVCAAAVLRCWCKKGGPHTVPHTAWLPSGGASR